MENTEINAGIPDPKPAKRGPGAAARCRLFLECEGWDALFRVARGEPAQRWVRGAFGAPRNVTVSPSFETQVKALQLAASYGYGRPAELAAADDSGRTVTDLLLSALGRKGLPGEGAE